MYDPYPYALERVVSPTLEPLTLAETKLYLRIDSSEEDAQIIGLMKAARAAAECSLRRSLMPQQWRLAADDHFGEQVRLPMGPVTSIVRVASYDLASVMTTIPTTTYQLNASKSALLITGGIYGNVVEILYATGYASAEKVPSPIRQGLLQHIAAMYALRGETVVPEGSLCLYAPFREVRL